MTVSVEDDQWGLGNTVLNYSSFDIQSRRGIDTIRLAGEVTDAGLPDSVWREHVDKTTGEVHRRVRELGQLNDGTNIQVSMWGDRRFASIERSVPTWLYGHNLTPATVADVHAWAATVHTQASEFVTWRGGPESMRVTRIDGVVDFINAGDPDTLLDALSRVKVPRVSRGGIFRDDRNAAVQTLTREAAGKWRVSTYSKAAELANLSRRARTDVTKSRMLAEHADTADLLGQLRFEAQMRTDFLTRHQVMVLGDLDEALLDRLRRNLFDRCRMGTPVTSLTRLAEILGEMKDDPTVRRTGLAALMWARAKALGIEWPMSANTRKVYEGVAERYGFADLSLTEAASDCPGRTVRLDYPSGVVVRN